MRLFTWYDVEVELKRNRNLWPLWWNILAPAAFHKLIVCIIAQFFHKQTFQTAFYRIKRR